MDIHNNMTHKIKQARNKSEDAWETLTYFVPWVTLLQKESHNS